MQSASYQTKSDFIILSIKAEISLKINSFISSALHFRWRDIEEQRGEGWGGGESTGSDAVDKNVESLSVWI